MNTKQYQKLLDVGNELASKDKAMRLRRRYLIVRGVGQNMTGELSCYASRDAISLPLIIRDGRACFERD